MKTTKEDDSSVVPQRVREVLRWFRHGDPQAVDHRRFRWSLALLASLLLVGNWWFFVRHSAFRIGAPAPRTYFSVARLRYSDPAETQENRRWVEEHVDQVVVRQPGSVVQIQRRLELLESAPTQDFLSPELQSLLKAFPGKEKVQLLQLTVSLGRRLLTHRDGRVSLSEQQWDLVSALPVPQGQKNVVFQILTEVFSNSLASDGDVTRLARQALGDSVRAAERDLPSGRVLAYRGQVVTDAVARLLREEGFPDASFSWSRLAFVFFAVLAWGFWPAWLERREKLNLGGRAWAFVLLLLGLIWGIQLLAAGRYVDTLGIMALGAWFFLAFPNAFAFHLTLGGGVLGALLAFSPTPSFLGLQTIQAGVAAGLGYLLFKGLNSRMRLLQSLALYGLCLVAVSCFLRWGLGIVLTSRDVGLYLLLCALWSSLVLALLPLWESLFDVVSPLRLMELSNPSNPLLKRLQVETPGTYHHVLMVGTLAEAAAEVLGLDGLLVRAGAYYHDIGKLRRPKFFVENQNNGENVHDHLAPSLSALVILSHVRDGLEIAQEYGLPKVLRSFIPEHHGTTCLAYFFRKSKNLGESLPVEQFCYPGPRPRSKETALVMLADSVEAAVKASTTRAENPEDLRELVEEVIQSKIASHQLDHVDFSLRDLTVIRETFLEILRSMRHSRTVRALGGSGEEPQKADATQEKVPEEGGRQG